MVKLLFEALVAIGRRQLAGESLIFFFFLQFLGRVGFGGGVGCRSFQKLLVGTLHLSQVEESGTF